MWRTIKDYIAFVLACIACFGSALIMLPITMYMAYRDEKEIDDDLRKADGVRKG